MAQIGGSGGLQAAGMMAINPALMAPAAQTYLTGRGIDKRSAAQSQVERDRIGAIMRYRQQGEAANQQVQQAGSEFQRQSGESQVGELGDRAQYARMSPMLQQQAYAKAMQGATAAQQTAQMPQQAQLTSAAQQAYAQHLAGQAEGRAQNAMMPGAYTQAMNQVQAGADRLGDKNQLQQAQIGQDAGQMQQIAQLRQAEIERQYAERMSGLGVQSANANQAGSEQMMYGQMIGAAMNTGMAGAGAYNQYQMGEQNRAKNEAQYSDMMKYYSQRERGTPDQEQYAQYLGSRA